ncbi:cell surface protein [Corynebacterium renale]|uniref:YPDG domain-containing protein n=1 Tax=Corynebacterium renale TaxID=1724 RepID=UPI000DA33895|nr:YPDG domain-containing protein [Corynebacterium renale]SQG63504.1 cell surface protein [Corynebacterium renale]
MVKKFRKHSRTGVTFISAISIALGGTAVVSTPATAQEGGNSEAVTDLQPGLAQKYGTVVNEVANAQNNLAAGSCNFSLVENDQGKEGVAGLRFWALNPSPTSVSKTEYGISLHFDKSQGRTFNDWFVTDSQRNVKATSETITADPVGTKAVGTDELDDITVSHQASEVAEVVDGRQSKFDLVDELTGEKIKQMATGEGVTYSWRSNYPENNPNNKFFTGGNFEVNGTVNPWPGEYNDCSPITVNWKQIEKQVITPGEETTVGTINLKSDPGLLDRLVVEAYDPQGKFLGTSDVAESGGEQMLSIAENGEIKFTWPEYVGTDLQAQQGARFAVFAKPRSVEELQQIANKVESAFEPVVTKESIDALQRYNKPNLVDTHQISLDDTQFHDPDYINNQQSIINGVKSEDGPVLDEKARQTVTFRPKPNPDNPEHDLAKLVAENKATVTLDKQYVYDGWEAELNDDYSVTVISPVAEKTDPGTFAMPKVVVTYTNGSKDILPLLVTVDPNDTDKTHLIGPKDATQGTQGTELKVQLKRTPAFGNHPASVPKEWKVEDVPEGWTVTVADDGTVTAKADESVPNNTPISPKVTAVYQDGTIDEVYVPFIVAKNIKVPKYAGESGRPNEELKLQAELPERGYGGNTTDEKPSRYTFPDDSLTYTDGLWTVTIDENTGELTTKVPQGALPGAFITVPVKTHYASGSPAQQTSGTFTVIGTGNGTDVPHYPPRQTKPGTAVTSQLNTQLKNPEDATYVLPPENEWPTGWKFTVDEAGNVTSTPPADAKPGDKVSIPVTVHYPDGSEGKVPAEVTVVKTDAEANDPSYPTKHGKAGQKGVKSPVDTSRMHPGEKTYSIITDPEAYGYIAPPARLGSWDKVKIDSNTGEITTDIPGNALPGSSADIPVLVTYEDGTKDITKATVVVEGERAQVYSPEYKQQVTKPGVPVDSSVSTEAEAKDMATDNPYKVKDGADLKGWTVVVDKSGKVTATPPKDAKSGDSLDVPIVATYEDDSTKEVFAAFVVQTLDKDVHEPVYPVESTTPGNPVERDVAPPALPKGSTFKIDQPGNGWEYKIDPITGKITVTPPADAKPGDKDVQNVTVTYPDGSTEEIPVTTVVNLTNNYEAEPVYPAENVYPGEDATSPLNVEKPDGLTFAAENPYTITQPADDQNWKPTGKNNKFGNPIYTVKTANGDWTVSLDDEGNVLSTAPETAKPGDQINVPVTVKYSDGSTDLATAPIVVVDRPTRKVPFGVKYKYDPELPAGTYKVETKGVVGIDSQQMDGSWKETKAPINEVVKVGTKPVEWTEPIPFETEFKVNKDLAPGTSQVTTQGKPGEKTVTLTSITDENGVISVQRGETENTKPVTHVVEYNPDPTTGEVTMEFERDIPFNTEVVKDPTLPAGTIDRKTEGVVGKEKVTKTQKTKGDQPDGPVVETTETITPAKDALIHVGTGKVSADYDPQTTEPGSIVTLTNKTTDNPAGTTYKV